MPQLDFKDFDEDKEKKPKTDFSDFDTESPQIDIKEPQPVQEPSWWDVGISMIDWDRMTANPIYEAIETAEEGGSALERLSAPFRGLWEAASYPGQALGSKFGINEPPERRSKDWFDLLEDKTDLSPFWVSTLGLTGSYLGDPVDWFTGGITGFGNLVTKLDDVTRKAITKADDVVDVSKAMVNEGIEKGSKLHDDVIKAWDKGFDFSKAGSMAEEAQKGQRAFLNFKPPQIPGIPLGSELGKPVIKGEGILRKADEISDKVKRSTIGDLFVTKPPDVSDTAWDLKKQYDNFTEYRIREDAIQPGKEFYQEFAPKVDDITDPKYSKYIETGESISDKAESVLNTRVINRAQQMIDEERQAGLIAGTLDDMGYFPRKMTKKAKEAFAKYAPDELKSNLKLGSAITTDPHQIRRTPQFQNLTVEQINNLGRKGEFEELFGSYRGKVFETNPVLAQTKREIVHQTKMANADYIKDMIGKGLDEGFVIKIGDAKVPKGFKEIKSPGDYKNLLEGYAFKKPEAELIEGTTKMEVPEKYQKALNLWDKFWKEWKTGALLGGGSWFTKNAIGNTVRMFEGGFNNPALLGKTADIIRDIRKGNPIKGTIKTARGNIDLNKAVNELSRRGILDQGLYRDVREALGQQLSDKAFISKIKSAGFGVHKVEEDITRMAMALDAVKKGYGYDEAAKISRATLFDYPDLTDFEKGFFKRFVSPFYTYYRKNLPFQLKKMYENPAGYKLPEKVTRAINSYTSQKEGDYYIPEWLRDMTVAAFPVGDKGEIAFSPVGQYIPTSEPEQLVRDPIEWTASKSNPMSQLLYDLRSGVKSFSGQEIPMTDTAFGIPMSGKAAHALKGSWRPINTASDITEALLGYFRDRDETGEQEPFETEALEEVLGSLLGFPSYTYTQKERDIMRAGEASDLEDKIRQLKMKQQRTDNTREKIYLNSQIAELKRQRERLK